MKRRRSHIKNSQTNPILDPTPIRSASIFNEPNRKIYRCSDVDPKTSEFAFFKKLKADADQRFRSRPVELKSSCEPTTEVGGAKRGGISLQDGDSSQKFMQERVVEKEIVGSGTPLQDMHDVCKNVENQCTRCKDAEIFSRKRQKLHQWVVDTSFPGTEILSLKGSILVSLLLSRLFPESMEESNRSVFKSKEVEMGIKSRVLTSSEIDINFIKSNLIDENLLGHNVEPPVDFGFSSYWLDCPEEKELLCSSPLSHHSSSVHLENSIREFEFSMQDRRTPFICFKNQSALRFDSKEDRCIALGHCDELNDHYYANKFLSTREPQVLLLGWDFDGTCDERKMSVSCPNTYLGWHPESSYKWDDDEHQQILDTQLAVRGLFTLPLLSCHQLIESSSKRDDDDHQQILLDNQLAVRGIFTPPLLSYHQLRDLPSLRCSITASSSNKSCEGRSLSIYDDTVAVLNNSTSFESISRSPSQSQLWSMDNCLNEHQCSPDTETKSRFDFYDMVKQCTGFKGYSRYDCWTCPADFRFRRADCTCSSILSTNEYESSPLSSIYDGTINQVFEDTFNIHNPSSFSFPMDFDREAEYLRLLDKSNWGGGVTSDDGEVRYFI